MGIYKKSIDEYVRDLSSSKATPGGGAVAAFSLLQGAALLSMVIEITVANANYQHFHSGCLDAKTSVQALMKEGRALIKDDMDAFNALMKAFKEKGSERNTLISEASIKAVGVPLRILEKAEEGIQLANMLINKSNPNVESDIEVAIECFECAGRSAIVNVRVNLPGLNDGDKADEYLEKAINKLEYIEEEGMRLREEMTD